MAAKKGLKKLLLCVLVPLLGAKKALKKLLLSAGASLGSCPPPFSTQSHPSQTVLLVQPACPGPAFGTDHQHIQERAGC